MEVTRTKDTYVFNKDRELLFKDDKIFFRGSDVTPISERVGDEFVAVMGKVGGRSFHNYFLKDASGKWYKLTGVTSALDYAGDKSNLMQWYADMMAEQFGWVKQNRKAGEDAATYKARLDKSIEESLDKFLALSKAEQIEYIKKARTAASQRKDKAADLGTTVHADIETYIKSCLKETEGIAREVFEFSTPESRDQVQHFVDWAVKNKVKFRASELRVYSRSMWVGGTCDIVLEIDGSLYLGDIKTTNSIWGRSYYAQCAAYRMCLEEMYPGTYSFAGSIIVRIGRDGLFNPEDDVYFSQYYEDDKKFFLAGLEIYRQENNVFAKQ